MSVYKQKFFGIAIAHFGEGTVGMYSCPNTDGLKSISFETVRKRLPIGQKLDFDKGKTDLQLGCKIRLLFNDNDSIDNLINELEKLKVLK